MLYRSLLWRKISSDMVGRAIVDVITIVRAVILTVLIGDAINKFFLLCIFTRYKHRRMRILSSRWTCLSASSLTCLLPLSLPLRSSLLAVGRGCRWRRRTWTTLRIASVSSVLWGMARRECELDNAVMS